MLMAEVFLTVVAFAAAMYFGRRIVKLAYTTRDIHLEEKPSYWYLYLFPFVLSSMTALSGLFVTLFVLISLHIRLPDITSMLTLGYLDYMVMMLGAGVVDLSVHTVIKYRALHKNQNPGWKELMACLALDLLALVIGSVLLAIIIYDLVFV